MKKLLTLFLVLAMTSWASGAIILTVSTETSPTTGDFSDPGNTVELAACSTIWIGVYNTVQGSAGGGTQQFTALPRFADTENGEWTDANAIYQPPAVPDNEGSPFNSYLGVLYGYDYWYANMSNGVPTDYTGVGTTCAFEFHCLEADTDVLIELVDGSTGYVVDTLNIHQVPEPITIALLGIGGLFLRRRK